MMLLTNEKHVKYKKKTDAVLLQYWHQFHDGQLWTHGNEARPDVWDESVSTGC